MQPATALADAWWLVSLRAGPLASHVRCHVGRPWEDATGTWRLLMWRPVGADAAALPVMRGVLGLTSHGGLTTVVLDGRYRPPGGKAGAAVDAGGLRRVAQSTAHRFVSDVASRLREQHHLASVRTA